MLFELHNNLLSIGFIPDDDVMVLTVDFLNLFTHGTTPMNMFVYNILFSFLVRYLFLSTDAV